MKKQQERSKKQEGRKKKEEEGEEEKQKKEEEEEEEECNTHTSCNMHRYLWICCCALFFADCSFCSCWLSIGCLVLLHLAGLLVFGSLLVCSSAFFLCHLACFVGCSCWLLHVVCAQHQWKVLAGARRRRRRRRGRRRKGRSKKQEARSKKEEGRRQKKEEKKKKKEKKKKCINMHTCIDTFGCVDVRLHSSLYEK